MNYLKEVLKRGMLGILIGAFINQVIFSIIAVNTGINGDITAKIVVDQFLISAILGFFMAAESVIFSIETWSTLKQTIVHFIVMSIVFFPISIVGKWMPENVVGKIVYVIIFVLIYVVIWVSYRIYWNKKIRELNHELKKRK